MRQGRHIVLCSAAFLCGDLLGGWFPLPAFCYLFLALGCTACTLFWRKSALILLTFLLLGATAVQTARLPGHAVVQGWMERRCHAAQQACARRLETLLPGGSERAVVKALALGDKQELDRITKRNYRTSGASHLLALSGLHVGILYKLLVFLFFPFGGNPRLRKIRSLALLGFLWFYALLSGMSSSISRAVLMITLYEGASLANRPRDGWNALAISALLITLFHPEAPREIGFQLSFSACIGIFGLYPRLKGLLRTRLQPLAAIWKGAALAISCQAATFLPVWLYFRSFPRYFLITNLLTLPLVTATLYLTAFTLAVSATGAPARLPAAMLQEAVRLLNRVVAQIAALP